MAHGHHVEHRRRVAYSPRGSPDGLEGRAKDFKRLRELIQSGQVSPPQFILKENPRRPKRRWVQDQDHKK